MFTNSVCLDFCNPEIIYSLRELGYVTLLVPGDWGGEITTQHLYQTVVMGKTKEKGVIDCGGNANLFIALAALRDDIDKNQWIMIPTVDPEWTGPTDKLEFVWKLCHSDNCGTMSLLSHKAAPKELIHHFGDE